MGVRVNETTSDISVAAATVKPNSLKNEPIVPLTRPTGAKMTTSTSVIASAASPISARPLTAAWGGAAPRARWRRMLSRMTMESSTRMPMLSTSPSVLSSFKLKPSRFMITNAASSVVGIDSSTINETRNRCRNSSRMTAVRMTAVMSSSWTPATAVLIAVLVSETTSSCASAGQLSAQSGQLLVDRVGNGGRVGTVLLGQPQQHTRMTIHASHAGRYLARHLDRGHVAQVHRGVGRAANGNAGQLGWRRHA